MYTHLRSRHVYTFYFFNEYTRARKNALLKRPHRVSQWENVVFIYFNSLKQKSFLRLRIGMRYDSYITAAENWTLVAFVQFATSQL